MSIALALQMDLQRYHSLAFDPYKFSAEKMSEAHVFDVVSNINSYIDQIIVYLVTTLESRWSTQYKTDTGQEITADIDLRATGPIEDVSQFLANENCTSENRFFILEALLRDMANKMIYEKFFEGEKFFGINSANARLLEQVYDAICMKGIVLLPIHQDTISKLFLISQNHGALLSIGALYLLPRCSYFMTMN